MRTIQTEARFPLSSVKPLEALTRYRAHCLEETRKLLSRESSRRAFSPVTGSPLKPFGTVDSFEYLVCPDTGSLFLASLPAAADWAGLLKETHRVRHSPGGFHSELAASRGTHVYQPKVEWIQETLALQGIRRPALLEGGSAPGDLQELLTRSGSFSRVEFMDETVLAHGASPAGKGVFQAVVLLESLDRSDDPARLLEQAERCLARGGLLFVTALVASGFDFQVLGTNNRYFYPPDRTNCFTLNGLQRLLERFNLELVEVSTPGVLDVEIVQAHLAQDPSLPVSCFERALALADEPVRQAFQSFLQEKGLSSYARLAARKI